MSKDVPELQGMSVDTRRRVNVNMGLLDLVSLTPTGARRLAAILLGRFEAREAMAFLLIQGADAIDTQQPAVDDAHVAWLKTQPERP